MEDLKIKLRIERMIVFGYSALRQFPKSEKHTLAAEIRQSMYRLLRQVIVTNRRYHKKTTAQEIDAELDLLRSLVRVSLDLGFLPMRRYQTWAEHLYEIGCMVGGWLQWIRQHPPTPPEHANRARQALPA